MKRKILLLIGIASLGAVAFGNSTLQDIANLLPQALVLWEATTIFGWLKSSEIAFVACADFNGDSIPDLLFSEYIMVWIRLGTGNGTFSEPEMVAVFPLEDKPLSFRTLAGLVSDLDGDGNLDLLLSTVKEEEEGAVYLFKNLGHGFICVEVISLPASTDWMALLDVDGNGKQDLLAPRFNKVTYETEILMFPRIGDFSFGEPRVVGKGRGWPVDIGDVNGDGFPDLALVDYDATRWPETGFVTVLLGEPGSFSKLTIQYRASFGLVRHAALADLDGDGKAELVVTVPKGLVVGRYVDGEITEEQVFETDPVSLEKVWLVDMDGDGYKDAVVASLYYREIAVYAGDGLGRFKGRIGECALPLGFVRSLYLPDLDGDGIPDVVVNYDFHLLLLRNGGYPLGSTSIPAFGARLLAAGDLDGNKGIDIVIQVQNRVEILWNNGWGGLIRTVFLKEATPIAAAITTGYLFALYQEKRIRYTPWPEHYTGYRLRAYSPSGELLSSWDLGENVVPALSIGDLDADGKPDLVGTKFDGEQGFLWVLWGCEELAEYPLPAEAAFAVTGDFEKSEGDEVCVVCIAENADLRFISFLDRQPRLSEPLLQVAAQPLALSAGDFDGDGLADPVFLAFTLEVVTEPNFAVTVGKRILGVWGSSLRQGRTFELDLPPGDLPWMLDGLAVGDLTGDGQADIVFTTLAATGPIILPGHGDGAFREPKTIPAPLGPILLVDLDGNGRLELVGSTQTVNPWLWIRWNEGGEK